MKWYSAKIVPLLVASLMTTSCSANLELDELISTGATALTATATSAAGLPPAVVLTASGTAGVLTATQTGPSVEVMAADFAGEDGELGPFELLAFAWATFSQHLLSLGALLGIIWLASIYLGMRRKRPEEKLLEGHVMTLLDKIGQMKED